MYPPVQDYCEQRNNLQKVFARNVYMDPPVQSRQSATSSAATKQNIYKFPARVNQHLAWLMELLRCKSIDDVDQGGWNILHHLFHAMSASILACNIATNMASSEFPPVKGDMRRALQQKTTGTPPLGCTPVHLLCTNMDTEYKKMAIIKVLLDKEVLQIEDFDVPDNEKVTYVFLFFLTVLSHLVSSTCFQPRGTPFPASYVHVQQFRYVFRHPAKPKRSSPGYDGTPQGMRNWPSGCREKAA